MAGKPKPFKASVDKAVRVDHRGAADRRLLRKALHYVREQLQLHLHAHYGIEAQALGSTFSSRRAADLLFDFLLEIEALDLIGVAMMIQHRDEGEVMAQRRKHARRAPRRLPEAPQVAGKLPEHA